MKARKALRRRSSRHPLAGLRNVGPAMRADFDQIGVASIDQLAASEPDQLYMNLQCKTGRRHDPCVWDVFAAAVHQARTGDALDWWAFTPLRKARQDKGDFPVF